MRDREVKRREDNSNSSSKSFLSSLLFSSWMSRKPQRSTTGKTLGTSSVNSRQGPAKSSGKSGNSSKNPSVAGTSSTASNSGSTASETEEDDESCSDEFYSLVDLSSSSSFQSNRRNSFSYKDLFEDTNREYRFKVSEPVSKVKELYRTSVAIGDESVQQNADVFTRYFNDPCRDNLFPKTTQVREHEGLSTDDLFVFTDYIQRGKTADTVPMVDDLHQYQKYVDICNIATVLAQ